MKITQVSKNYIYRNSFHDTIAVSRYSPEEYADYYAGTRGGSWVRERKMEDAAKRLRGKLCGISDCQCSSWIGVR